MSCGEIKTRLYCIEALIRKEISKVNQPNKTHCQETKEKRGTLQTTVS